MSADQQLQALHKAALDLAERTAKPLLPGFALEQIALIESVNRLVDLLGELGHDRIRPRRQ